MAEIYHNQEAERLLSEANLWRVRGNPEKAEEAAAHAVELAPSHAGARELHGDMLQLLGELEKALAEYQEALRLEPGRPSAETRFARVTLAIAAEKARKESNPTDPESILKLEAAWSKQKSPVIALIYSLAVPGAGQFYNGEKEKGAVILGGCLLVALILLLPIAAFVVNLYARLTGSFVPGKGAETSLWGPVGLLLLLAIAVYSARDAYLTAKRLSGRL